MRILKKLNAVDYFWDKIAFGIKASYQADMIDRTYSPHIVNTVSELTDNSIVWSVRIILKNRFDSEKVKIDLPYAQTERNCPDLESVIAEYNSLVDSDSKLMEAINYVFNYHKVKDLVICR